MSSDFSKVVRRALVVSSLASLALCAACYSGPTATPVRTEARAPQQAIVVLDEVDGNIFKFTVQNLSSETMIVDRDHVYLETPDGTRSRLPGGSAKEYQLAPGATHAVNVKFDLSNLPPGAPIKVLFDGGALTVRGVDVKVEGIPFNVQ